MRDEEKVRYLCGTYKNGLKYEEDYVFYFDSFVGIRSCADGCEGEVWCEGRVEHLVCSP